jgi:hypothetical protein
MKYSNEQIANKLEELGIAPRELEDIADTDMYDEYLDEIYDSYGAPFGLNGSRVLQETDPIQYRVGYNDWADMFLSDGEYVELFADEWFTQNDIDTAIAELDSQA